MKVHGDQTQGAPTGDEGTPLYENSNIINDSFLFLQQFLQAYGWYIVLALIAYYMLKPHIESFQKEISLRQANNPTRLKILDEERKRVRLQQQLEFLKAKDQKETTMNTTDSKKVGEEEEEVSTSSHTTTLPIPSPGEASSRALKKRTLPPPKKPIKKTVFHSESNSSSGSSTYNPLLGGGSSGSTFRPSSSNRNQGRRRGG